MFCSTARGKDERPGATQSHLHAGRVYRAGRGLTRGQGRRDLQPQCQHERLLACTLHLSGRIGAKMRGQTLKT